MTYTVIINVRLEADDEEEAAERAWLLASSLEDHKKVDVHEAGVEKVVL
jgi:hypothetical protein